jgi:sterol 3beta-glucosyltransferase
MAPNLLAGAASSTDDDIKKRVGKKLQKKRKDEHATPTMELPDRLKEGSDSSEEDVVAPQIGTMLMNMNQSIIGLITAAGSRVDFNDRFDGQSSDEDDEDSGTKNGKAQETDISKTTVFKKPGATDKSDRHRRKLSDHKLLRSLPALPRISRSKSKKEASKISVPSSDSNAPSEPVASPTVEITEEEARLAPVMSRMLEARQEMSSRPSFDLDRLSGEKGQVSDIEEGPSLLAKKLMEIFEFDQPETVIEGM